jgi:hypothetical protein
MTWQHYCLFATIIVMVLILYRVLCRGTLKLAELQHGKLGIFGTQLEITLNRIFEIEPEDGEFPVLNLKVNFRLKTGEWLTIHNGDLKDTDGVYRIPVPREIPGHPDEHPDFELAATALFSHIVPKNGKIKFTLKRA